MSGFASGDGVDPDEIRETDLEATAGLPVTNLPATVFPAPATLPASVVPAPATLPASVVPAPATPPASVVPAPATPPASVVLAPPTPPASVVLAPPTLPAAVPAPNIPAPPTLPAPVPAPGLPAPPTCFLPHEVIWDIVSRLPPSLQDIRCARSVCHDWRAGTPHTMGPWLLMSLPDGAAEDQKFVAMQMKNTTDGEEAEISLVPWFSAPPLHSTFWGSAHGLLALKQMETNELSLFCIICGQRVQLPPLDGIPQGYFYNGAFQSFLTASGVPNHMEMGLSCVLHSEHLNWDLVDASVWEVYPGIDKYPMKSVVFKGRLMFGATEDNTIIVSDQEGAYITQLPVPIYEDMETRVWLHNGQHVFKCSDKVYACILFRTSDGHARASVFQIQYDLITGYHLVPKSDIGSFAVFLGSNQAFTLPIVEGSSVQCPNTIYVADDDGNIRNGRVLAIEISSNSVSSIPFPEGVNIDDHNHAIWVAAAHPAGPIIHCNQ